MECVWCKWCVSKCVVCMCGVSDVCISVCMLCVDGAYDV